MTMIVAYLAELAQTRTNETDSYKAESVATCQFSSYLTFRLS